jgi:methylated-DNA-protein-cysteine methyltransferase-like protein
MSPTRRPTARSRERAEEREPDRNRARILAVIESIPRGKVATYGTVARAAGLPGRARLVGRVLAELAPGNRVPWHRVVNAAGKISRQDAAGAALQRRRLEKEGVRFTAHGEASAHGGSIDPVRHFWAPASRRGGASA